MKSHEVSLFLHAPHHPSYHLRGLTAPLKLPVVSNFSLPCSLAFHLSLPQSFQCFCHSLISRCPRCLCFVPSVFPSPSCVLNYQCVLCNLASEFSTFCPISLPHVSQTFTQVRIHFVHDLLSEKMAAVANTLLLCGSSFSCLYSLPSVSWRCHSQKSSFAFYEHTPTFGDYCFSEMSSELC